jgi:hypothetical protein
MQPSIIASIFGSLLRVYAKKISFAIASVQFKSTKDFTISRRIVVALSRG